MTTTTLIKKTPVIVKEGVYIVAKEEIMKERRCKATSDKFGHYAY